MNTGTTWQTKSSSTEQTEQLAEKLGSRLKGGEVIELVSDLGGGKTTFVRGLVKGTGSSDTVASPTFTINKVYQGPHFEVQHFDFYRLNNPGVVADELAEVLGDPMVVTVIEWADAVQHVLPEDRLAIIIRQTSEGDRELTFKAGPEHSRVIEGL